MTRRALVTGSSGFVGSHVARRLDAHGWLVTGVDIAGPRDVATWTIGADVRRYLAAVDYRFDLVVHCAAVVGGRTMIDGQPLRLACEDLSIDAALFDWALRTRPGRVVYFSSSAAYPTILQAEHLHHRLAEDDLVLDGGYLGTPDATYGLVKLVGERLAVEARAEGIPVTVLRPFSGYGPGQALDYPFPALVQRALDRPGRFEVWGPGTQVRDFVHIDDVVDVVLRCVEQEIDGPLNVGTGRATSFVELAEMILAEVGHQAEIVCRPDMPTGVAWRVADTGRMREVLPATVPLERGVRQAVELARPGVAA